MSESLVVVVGVCVVSDDADVAGAGSVFAVSCVVATGACVEETVYCGLKPRIFCTVETDTAPEPLAAINASTAIFCCALVAASKTSLKLASTPLAEKASVWLQKLSSGLILPAVWGILRVQLR